MKPAIRRGLWVLLQFVLLLAVLLMGIWASLALWFQLAASQGLMIGSLVGWWLLTAAVLVLWFIAHRQHTAVWRYSSVGMYSVGLLILLGWWHTIQPQQQRQWAADVARQLEVEQQANLVTLHNVRNFEWRSETDFTPHWETRQYDLNKLSSLDVITSYWMGPKIAHVLLSFGFDDGQYVTFSVETRREQQEAFSTFGGFFRKFELSLIAADERDIIYTRTNIRKEQVYLYHLQVPKTVVRSMFESYLQEARTLQQHPKFYNTLSSNCTTVVFDMARLIDPKLPIDYRIVLSGYLPQYLYEQHALNTALSFKQLQQQAYLNPRAQQYTASGSQSSHDYSMMIRQKNISTP